MQEIQEESLEVYQIRRISDRIEIEMLSLLIGNKLGNYQLFKY